MGETWQFLGHSFLPYEDGLSLFVSPDGTSEWHIRLQWQPEGQGEVVDDLSRYIKPAQPKGDAQLLITHRYVRM